LVSPRDDLDSEPIFAVLSWIGFQAEVSATKHVVFFGVVVHWNPRVENGTVVILRAIERTDAVLRCAWGVDGNLYVRRVIVVVVDNVIGVKDFHLNWFI
jgi:hypothetical protein